MKKLIITLAFSCLIINILQAQKSFDEATFNEMMARWVKEPVSFFKNECDSKFIFINGNGESYNQEQAIVMFNNVIATVTKKVENLKVWQLGNTGIATGKVIESYVFKNGRTSAYTGIFTYTFSQQNDKWVMAAAQHTDYKTPKGEDEEAVKKAIEASTAYMYAANYDTYKNTWVNAPYITRVSVDAAGQVSRMNAEEYNALLEGYRKNYKTPTNIKITRSNFTIRINGTSAFVVFNQHNDNSDGTQRDSIEERYLEKINGEWKIVNVTVIPKK